MTPDNAPCPDFRSPKMHVDSAQGLGPKDATLRTLSTLPSDAARCNMLHEEWKRLTQLAGVLLEFYHLGGSKDLLLTISELHRANIQFALLSNMKNLPTTLTHLGDVQTAEFQLTHNTKALEEAIAIYTKALKLCSSLDLHSRNTTSGLAHALFHHYMISKSKSDYVKAMDLLATVDMGCALEFETNPPSGIDYQGLPWAVVILSLLRSTQISWSIIPVTSEEIRSLIAKIRSGLRSSFTRSRYLLCLIAEARLCWAMAALCQSQEYLHQGLQIAKSALQSCPRDAHVLRHLILTETFNLHYRAHHWFYRSTCESEHLDQAIEMAAQMRTSMLSVGNVHVRWNSLYNWARAAMDRATDEEDLDALELAVDAMKTAANFCPPSHFLKPAIISNLSYALGIHFDQTRRVSDLDEVINLQHLAAEYIADAPYLASNIAAMMLTRAEISDTRTADSIITQAIELCLCRQNAPGFAEQDQREKIAVESQLITASRLQLIAGVDPFLDVDRIMRLAQQDLLVEEEPSSRASLIMAHTDALVHMAQINRDNSRLVVADELVNKELCSEYVASSIHSIELNAARADILVAHSDLLDDREAAKTLLEEAWSLYHQAVTRKNTLGGSRERLQACLRWASHAASRGNPQEAFKAYLSTLAILPRLIFLGEDIMGRVETLRQVNGLATSSIAIALTIGNVASAIEFLEQTRGILWLQSFHTRITDLESLPDGLRKQFRSITYELEKGDSVKWATRRQLAEELGTVLEGIRSLPGLARFLLPPVLEDIQSVLRLRGGLAVIVAPSNTFCDVIMLGLPHGHAHLRLTALNTDRMRDWAKKFSVACADGRSAARNDAALRGFIKQGTDLPLQESFEAQVLRDLWILLVRPIFETLNLLNTCDRQRLWWCPIGVSGSLPLHAAGIYEGSNVEYAGMYAVSSYASTLTALHRVLTQSPVMGPTPQKPNASSLKILIVAQPDSAGLPSLPHAREEVALVENLAPTDSLIAARSSEGLTVASALRHVADAHILHLACHGHQDQANPLNSGFDLLDGRLTLGQLMRANIPDAQLAYLSACESAGMDESRPDEGLNLAGAMTFLGFQSVIATMWAMDDVDGPFVAERVYKRILQHGSLDVSMVSYALDDAVQALRESGVPARRWATYVHFGV